MNQSVDTLQEFYQDTLLALGPVADQGAEQLPNAPAVMVCAGAPDLNQLQHIRGQLPAGSYLLWLTTPCEQAAFLSFRKVAHQPRQRTLVTLLDPEATCRDKAALLVSLVADRDVQLIADQQAQMQYAQVVEQVNQSIKTAIENLNQDVSRGLLRLRCSLHNLPSMLRHAGLRLNRLPPGVDAVVCGAGPSLARQIEQLKVMREQAIVIVVGHAAPTLLRAGIQPDLVVSDDARAWWSFPADLDLRCPLAACTELSARIRERFARVIWFEGSSIPFNVTMSELGLRLNRAALNKTVSIHAIDIGLQLGCARIALVGQDLSIADSGVSHAEGSKVCSGDILYEIPGNEGRTVRTTTDLKVLREAIQDFLAAHHARDPDAVPIVNCTQGGALIQGAIRMTIKEFRASCGAAPPDRRELLVEEPDPSRPGPAALAAMGDEFHGYAAVCADMLAICKKLGRELERYPVNMEQVRKLQTDLQRNLEREKEQRSGRQTEKWLLKIMDYVDRIMKATPGMISQENDPQAQLRFLHARYRLGHDLCTDLEHDIDAVRAALAAGHDGAPTPADAPVFGPYRFDAFRGHALDTVRRNNPELADALRDRERWPLAPRYELRLVNQTLQHVALKTGNGEATPLSALFSMYEEAEQNIAAFRATSGFNPERHGLVVLAPGNWVHVLQWLKLCPELKLIVLEPWLDLFSTLIDCGCFLYPLPPDALIAGLHEACRKTKKLCRNQLKEWKCQGREPKLFIPPRIVDLTECAVLKARAADVLGM